MELIPDANEQSPTPSPCHFHDSTISHVVCFSISSSKASSIIGSSAHKGSQGAEFSLLLVSSTGRFNQGPGSKAGEVLELKREEKDERFSSV
jgi:hypothetical protein